MKITAAAFILFLSGGTTAAADLSLSADPRSIIVTPVREQSILLTAANAGPETVVGAEVVTTVPLSATQLAVDVAPEPACGAVVVTAGEQISINWQIAAIAAGSTVSCRFRFRALPTTSIDSSTVTWRISAPGNSDPNPFNSRVQAVVQHWREDRPSDINLTLLSPSNIVLLPGQSAIVEFRFRNAGPSTPNSVIALGNGYDFASGPGLDFRGYDVFGAISNPQCLFFKESEGIAVFYTQIVTPTTLSAGETAICRVQVQALAEATGTATLRFEAFGIGPGVYDSLPADNAVSVSIAYGAVQGVPVPAVGWAAMLALALTVLLSTWRHGSLR